MPSKNVVFDIVGTIIGYEKLFEAIETRLGEKLRARCILPKLLGYTWIEVTEREYTYSSLAGRYKPYTEVFELMFFRMLWMAGIEQPRDFATADDLKYILDEGNKKLGLRPGAAECVQKLRNAGFTVYAFTAGGADNVAGYFEGAGLDWPRENIMSTEDVGMSKPELAVYKPVLDKLSKEGQPWFAAAHAWDVSGAR